MKVKELISHMEQSINELDWKICESTIKMGQNPSNSQGIALGIVQMMKNKQNCLKVMEVCKTLDPNDSILKGD